MVLALTLAASAAPAQDEAQKQWAEQCADWDEWDKPGPPFKVHGDIYYVGTCGIAAILVAGNEGHVLIDTGTEAGAQVVLSNIRALGFDPADVTVLLMSHEHHDHTGGMAAMQQATGARLFVSPRAAEPMARGRASDDDPQVAEGHTQAPARVDGEAREGVAVQLGRIAFTPMDTPGHTPGAMSWRWQSCDGADCRTVVYADSLTPVSSDGYRFSDHPDYVAAFRQSLARIAALECDILLTPHPSASGMRDKLIAGDLSAGPTCRDYADALGKRLDERLAEEAGGK